VGLADLTSDAQSKPVAEGVADILDSTQAGGRIIRGGVLRLGSYVVMLALSVLSAVLLTRHLGPVRFGEYTTVLSLVSVVAAVTDAGMSTVGAREFAVREGVERDSLMRDLLGLRVALTSAGVVLVVGFAVAAGYDRALLLGAVLASLGTVALVVQHTHTIPIAAALRLGSLAVLDLSRQVITVAAIVALVLLGAGVLPLLAVALAANLALIAPTAMLARHQISLRLDLRPRRWASLLKLTVAFSLATAVGTIYVYTAQILTSLVSSSHQSGLFAASFRVFIVAAAVPGLVVGGALPLLARAARDDRERLSYALQRIFEVSLILGVAAALGLFAGAQFVIDVIAGSRYSGSVGPLQLLGVGMIASFVLAGWSFALLSLERYRGLLLANLAAFIVSGALTAILASGDGAEGAAIATVCGEAVLAVGSLLALRHGHPEFQPRPVVLAKVLLAALPAIALSLLDGVPSLVRALLALGAYAIVIVLTRAVPEELIELIPRPRRRAG
jgi:O-antigen/teichoic acid export membrane protein